MIIPSMIFYNRNEQIIAGAPSSSETNGIETCNRLLAKPYGRDDD